MNKDKNFLLNKKQHMYMGNMYDTGRQFLVKKKNNNKNEKKNNNNNILRGDLQSPKGAFQKGPN